MKKQTGKQTKLEFPICGSCKKTALFESVKTVEPGPFAILWEVGGNKALGLIKVDPHQCHLQHYCVDHVPKLDSTKLMWIKDYAGELDPKKVFQNEILIRQELGRAAKAVGKKTGAVLTIEYGYEIGKMGIEPEDIQPIVEAIRQVYSNAAVIITENYKTNMNIGIDPAYIGAIKKAIVDIDEQVSAVMKERNKGTKQKSGKVRSKKKPNVAIRHGEKIGDLFFVCPESIAQIWEVIWDMTRPVTIKMQHGDDVVLTSVNPRDLAQVMDAVIEICGCNQVKTAANK